jgi:small subunit ribosomal protein S16
MAVKIRLQRHGRSKRPFYHIVVADSKARRDGKFIDRIGDYNPLTIPATINLNFDRAFKWVMEGAEPTDTCARILGYKGVLYKKHLARGVRKGAFSQEEADKKFAAWLEEKTQKIEARVSDIEKASKDKKATRVAAEAKKRAERDAAKVAAAAPAEEATAVEESPVAEMPEAETPATETPETPAE